MLPRRTSPLRARASHANSAIQSITFRNIALAIIDRVGCIIESAMEHNGGPGAGSKSKQVNTKS